MKKHLLALIVILSCTSFCYSQTILWEKEIINDGTFWRMIYTKIIEDNNHNYLCAVKEHQYRNLITVKLNQDGEVKYLKNYYLPYAMANSNLSLTDSGNYHFLQTVYHDTARGSSAYQGRVPQVLVTDTNGNIIYEKYNKALFDSKIYDNYHSETIIDYYPFSTAYFYVNKLKEIYTAFQRDQLENNSVINHFIIKKFSSDCTLEWKFGYDSLNYMKASGYALTGFCSLNDSEFVALVYHYQIKDGAHKTEYEILKIDTSGKKVFSKLIILPDSTISIKSLLPSSDGNIIMIGNYNGDYKRELVLKFDKNCDSIVSSNIFRTDYSRLLFKTLELSDGSFVQIGQSKLDSAYSFYIRKLDNNFELIWEKDIVKSVFAYWLDDVIETSDGNLVFSGKTNPFNDQFNNLYICKIKDTTLNIIYPVINGSNSVCIGDTLAYSTKYDANSKIFWNVENGNLIKNYGDTLVKIFWNNVGTGRIFVSKNSIHTDRKDTTSFNINVNELPQKPSIVFKEDTLFSSSASGNQWYKNGELIFGATAHYFMPIDSGIYSVQVSISGCSSEMSDNFSIDAMSVEETGILSSLILSPNPVNDFLEISGAVGEIRIFNVFGVIVKNPTPTLPEGEGLRIDVSGLAPGVYFVRVGNQVRKFIKI